MAQNILLYQLVAIQPDSVKTELEIDKAMKAASDDTIKKVLFSKQDSYF